MASVKLHDIDQKIKDLQDRKKLLEQKQINDLAKLIKKIDAHILPPEILLGSLSETLAAFYNNDDKINQWTQKGKNLLNDAKKKRGGEKDVLTTFRQPKKSAKADS